MCEKVTKVLWSQLIQGLKDHCFRFTGNQLVNGPPSNSLDKRSAWDITAAICCYPSSTILKFLLYEIFSEQKDFHGYLMDFLASERIFAKSVRDFFGNDIPFGAAYTVCLRRV